MTPEQARLARLKRIERMRAIAREAAAAEAAEAEASRAQFAALAQRTRALADDYAARASARDGAELRQTAQFASGLQQVRTATAGDEARAQALADERFTALGEAERRRAAVEERIAAQVKAMAQGSELPALGARRAAGTGLE